MFIDLYSLEKKEEKPSCLEVEAATLQESFQRSCPHSFNFSTEGYNHVYFASYENGVMSASHPDAYGQGSGISRSRYKESDTVTEEVKIVWLTCCFIQLFKWSLSRKKRTGKRQIYCPVLLVYRTLYLWITIT